MISQQVAFSSSLLLVGMAVLTMSTLLGIQLIWHVALFVLPKWPSPILPIASAAGVFFGLLAIALGLGILIQRRRRRAPYQTL